MVVGDGSSVCGVLDDHAIGFKPKHTYQRQPRELGGGGDMDGEARGGHEDELADVLRVEADEVDGDGPAHGGAHDVVGPRPEVLLEGEEELRQLACWLVGGWIVVVGWVAM